MSSVAEIEAAIEKMSVPQVEQLAHWLEVFFRGVRHKLLTFNRIKHAFESGESTNWPRILTHLFWWTLRSVIAMRC